VIELVLVDRAPTVVEALQQAFAEHPEVTVLGDSILSVAENTIVSPANSYGYMDGGVDRLYVAAFGLELEQRVQRTIDRVANGMLPVGSAVLVDTGMRAFPFSSWHPRWSCPAPRCPQRCSSPCRLF
jgi:hypothetical protein